MKDIEELVEEALRNLDELSEEQFVKICQREREFLERGELGREVVVIGGPKDIRREIEDERAMGLFKLVPSTEPATQKREFTVVVDKSPPFSFEPTADPDIDVSTRTRPA